MVNIQFYNLKTKEKLYGKGDFVVNAEGYHYVCNNWKSNKKLFCHNIFNNYNEYLYRDNNYTGCGDIIGDVNFNGIVCIEETRQY